MVGQRGRPNWSRVSWEVHVESVAAEATPLLTGVVVSLLLLLLLLEKLWPPVEAVPRAAAGMVPRTEEAGVVVVVVVDQSYIVEALVAACRNGLLNSSGCGCWLL